MRSVCPGKGYFFSCAAAALILCAPAWGSLVTYTVDPTQSSLILSGNWNGAPLFEKPAGSLVTTFGGSIQADISLNSIQVTQANLDANPGGNYQPGVNGQRGAHSADYGGFFRSGCFFAPGNLNVALRDVVLDLNSAPMAIEAGTFDPRALGVTAAGGSMDYAGTGILGWFTGKGRAPLIGDEVANKTKLLGSLTSADTLETLVIPIYSTFQVKIDSPLPSSQEWFNLTLRGSIVATRTLPGEVARPIPENPNPPGPEIPEPATLSLLMLGMALMWTRRRRCG
jgi:hypothetical protein